MFHTHTHKLYISILASTQTTDTDCCTFLHLVYNRDHRYHVHKLVFYYHFFALCVCVRAQCVVCVPITRYIYNVLFGYTYSEFLNAHCKGVRTMRRPFVPRNFVMNRISSRVLHQLSAFSNHRPPRTGFVEDAHDSSIIG